MKNRITNAEIFWTALLVITLIVLAFTHTNITILVLIALTILSFICLLDIIDLVENKDRPVLWILLMLTTWVVALVIGIVYAAIVVYEKTIVNFNKYLNGRNIF